MEKNISRSWNCLILEKLDCIARLLFGEQYRKTRLLDITWFYGGGFYAGIDYRAIENRWLCVSFEFFMSVFLCDSTPRFRLWTSEQRILQGTLGKKRQVEYLHHRRLATSQPACEALEPETELHPERWNSTTALLGEVCHRIILTVSRTLLQYVVYSHVQKSSRNRMVIWLDIVYNLIAHKSDFKLRTELRSWYSDGKQAKAAYFT